MLIDAHPSMKESLAIARCINAPRTRYRASLRTVHGLHQCAATPLPYQLKMMHARKPISDRLSWL